MKAARRSFEIHWAKPTYGDLEKTLIRGQHYIWESFAREVAHISVPVNLAAVFFGVICVGLATSTKCPLLLVRPEGMNLQWRQIPPRKLSIDLEADGARLGNRQGRSRVTKVALRD
jgi:hypothetical protein